MCSQLGVVCTSVISDIIDVAGMMQAMISQVRHDHALLRERIQRLTGPDGVHRLVTALEHVRNQVAVELQDTGSDASFDSERWVKDM